MSFLYPGWLLLLLILPFILLGAILTHRGRGEAWKRMVAPRLRKQLVKESSSSRQWLSLALGLLGSALLVVVIARPYQGETTSTEKIRTRNILIAVDTSRSMLVEDVSPNRIGNAKTMALELMRVFPNDRIGVIAFSGIPVLMAPLTIDHSAIHETISQLDTRVIPSGGSDIAATVDLAIKTFKKSGHKSNALIIISDGEDHSQQIGNAGDAIREAGIAACTIGVGKENGGIIPDLQQPDGKFRDNSGQTVLSRLNAEALDQLARAGGGIYVTSDTGADNAVHTALSFLKSDQQSGRKISVPTESYQWFLFPAILLLALSLIVRSNMFTSQLPTTTTLVITTLLTLCTPQAQLHAASDVDRAAAAYEAKDYQTALDHFSKALETAQGEDRRAIQFSQGGAAYRLKQWHEASRYFSRALLSNDQSLLEQTHYNLANSLFQTGWHTLNPPDKPTASNPFLELIRGLFAKKPIKETAPNQHQLPPSELQGVITNWQDAIGHYQAALDINPTNQDADYNLKKVEKLLKQLKDAIDQANKESEQADKPQQGDGDKPDPNNQGDGDKPDPDADSKGQGENDPNKKPDEQKQDEQDSEDQGDSSENPPPENKQPLEPREGESKEAFAARILKEHADAETRPVTRRLLHQRRPSKDW